MASKVTGKLLTASFNDIKGCVSFEAFQTMDSVSRMPRYNVKFDFENIKECLVYLMLIFYGIDNSTKKMQVIGTTIINIFLDPFSYKETEKQIAEYILNSGAFQLPIFGGDPRVMSQLNMENFLKLPKLSGATVLIRIYPSVKEVPSVINYEDGIYDSSLCTPTEEERKIYSLFQKESRDSNVETLEYFLTENKIDVKDDKKVKEYLEKVFQRTKEVILDASCVCRYKYTEGFKLMVSKAQNLPKKKPSLVIVSICPPGLLYNKITNDKCSTKNTRCTTRLHLDSEVRCPRFANDFFDFNTTYSPHLIAIIDIRYIDIHDKLIESHGWTFCRIFKEHDAFVNHGVFQLPLFKGLPTTVL